MNSACDALSLRGAVRNGWIVVSPRCVGWCGWEKVARREERQARGGLARSAAEPYQKRSHRSATALQHGAAGGPFQGSDADHVPRGQADDSEVTILPSTSQGKAPAQIGAYLGLSRGVVSGVLRRRQDAGHRGFRMDGAILGQGRSAAIDNSFPLSRQQLPPIVAMASACNSVGSDKPNPPSAPTCRKRRRVGIRSTSTMLRAGVLQS
jgi:hypothetical protein